MAVLLVLFAIWNVHLVVAVENLVTAEVMFDLYDDTLKVPYETVSQNLIFFEQNGVLDYQPILVDRKRNQVIVGARDYIFRLNEQSLTPLEKFEWLASEDSVDACLMRWSDKFDCRNFVRLLVLKEDGSLLACGTNALAPSCVWRKATALSTAVQQPFTGIGFVPFGPRYDHAYVFSKENHLYSGVGIDTSGHDSSFLRMMPDNLFLRIEKANSLSLNEPVFVAAFDVDPFIYFFFHETAMEVIGTAKVTYSRIARVCKNDIGGTIRQHGYWTTFTKARLICGVSDSESLDFVRSVEYVEKEQTFYVAFTSSDAGFSGSAICRYELSTVEKPFSGDFLYQNTTYSFWQPSRNRYPNFKCEVQDHLDGPNSGLTVRFNDAYHLHLMEEPVRPTDLMPMNIVANERYSKIAVHLVDVKPKNKVLVVFVVTKFGLLKKMVLFPKSTTLCIVEVVQFLPFGSIAIINDMKLNDDLGVLYVGTEDRMYSIPVQRCKRFQTKEKCIEAKDPYCGWNNLSKTCTPVIGSKSDSDLWQQDVDACPQLGRPVDGKFGPWSSWWNCPYSSDQGENCLCRTRECDSPHSHHGGSPCTGPMVQVVNCTQHGAWTKWHEWTPCSVTCGNGIRSRYRYCSNPPPAHGGRLCLGPHIQQEYCSAVVCPTQAPPAPPPEWSSWSEWESCSRPCGSGTRRRFRTCGSPSTVRSSQTCAGSDTEHRICNEKACEGKQVSSEWSQWLQANATVNSALLLKRFRSLCHTKFENGEIALETYMRSQEKMCSITSSECDQSAISGTWGNWLSWSDCSRSCGRGLQYRNRVCSVPLGTKACLGSPRETRECVIEPCKAFWSCWSEFSVCSQSCGNGVKHRRRTCIQNSDSDLPCTGEESQTVACNERRCLHDGYSKWSGWTLCNEFGFHVRVRACVTTEMCKDIPDVQGKRCVYEKSNAAQALEVKEDPEVATTGTNPVVLAVSVVCAFFTGVLLVVGYVFCGRWPTMSFCYSWRFGKGRTIAHPSALAPVKANIYTPPLIHLNQSTRLTANPFNKFEKKSLDDLTEVETALTLKRTMRTSLKTKDYL